MPNPFIAELRLAISFGEPLPLARFSDSIPELLDQGVYALREGACHADAFDPLGPEVKYIGKAIGETIFSRCRKHFWTVTDARDRFGAPKTRPGHRFKAYRSARQLNADGLYIFPALMTDVEPYLVSCAEELLLYRYSQLHGDIPAANTKG
jgi:hypothetical protein